MTTAEVAIVAYAEDAAVLRIAADELQRQGLPATARRHREWAALVDRARRAEDMDPDPEDRPWCVCERCQAWLFDAHWRRLT